MIGFVAAIVIIAFCLLLKKLSGLGRAIDKSDLRVLLRQAYDLLILRGADSEQPARDLQAVLLLDRFLGQSPGKGHAARIIGGVKTEIAMHVGKPIDPIRHFMWREAIHRANSLL